LTKRRYPYDERIEIPPTEWHFARTEGGEGADAQAPLARAVVGGLTASTLITLVLIPAVYSLFHPDARASRT
jgi:Cu/Ag efflux pump CusA